MLHWLRLVRLPNLATAAADSLAGYLVCAGLTAVEWPTVACWLAVLASLALYAAGMVLNVVYAVELDASAVEWTRRNVAEHADELARVGSRVEVIHDDAAHVADPGHALAALAGGVSVVSANPPYIPEGMIPREVEVRDHDPFLALYSGPDGLDAARHVIATAAVLLRSGGLLVMEHADIQGTDAGDSGVPALVSATRVDQALSERVPQLPGSAVFTSVADRSDLNGLPRFTMAYRT
jgi:methylase of polypeptide subunit release factors